MIKYFALFFFIFIGCGSAPNKAILRGVEVASQIAGVPFEGYFNQVSVSLVEDMRDLGERNGSYDPQTREIRVLHLDDISVCAITAHELFHHASMRLYGEPDFTHKHFSYDAAWEVCRTL